MTELLSSCDEARKRQRLREERKKILKICVNKLQMIQDPESYLCRSVLINNTLKTIQQENRQYLRQRARLKRQKDRVEEEDEPEIKKKCFDAFFGVKGNDSGHFSTTCFEILGGITYSEYWEFGKHQQCYINEPLNSLDIK